MNYSDEEKEELQELINLLYNNHLSQYGKRKLENYIKKQEAIIDKMAEFIEKGNDFDNRIKTKEQVKEYFKKEVEKDVEDKRAE